MRARGLMTLFVCGLAGCSTTDLQSSPFKAPSPLQAVSTEAAESPKSDFGSPWSWFNQVRGDGYALDDVARRLEAKTAVKCDPSTFKPYKGTSVAYAGRVLVDPAFIERLSRFEVIAQEVALEVYGRAPSKLLHAGAYACRKSRNRATRLSEHALGNALDVVGFSFGPTTKAQRADAPKVARGAFKVTVGQHWNAHRSEAGRLHRQFLRTLAERVVEAGVFRVALGPSHPGHGDHLHFDMSPWNYTRL